MSRRRDSRSTTFIVELKSGKLGGEIGFAFVDCEISIVRRIEILRDEISAGRFPKPLLRSTITRNTVERKERGGDCWT